MVSVSWPLPKCEEGEVRSLRRPSLQAYHPVATLVSGFCLNREGLVLLLTGREGGGGRGKKKGGGEQGNLGDWGAMTDTSCLYILQDTDPL